jgi:hypothetical protein
MIDVALDLARPWQLSLHLAVSPEKPVLAHTTTPVPMANSWVSGPENSA